jgi:hypothetical protein
MFGSGKWRTSKAVRAETGSEGSKAKSLLDERTGGTFGGGRRRRIRRPSSFGHRHIRSRRRDSDGAASDGGDRMSSDNHDSECWKSDYLDGLYSAGRHMRDRRPSRRTDRQAPPHFVGHPCVWQTYSLLGPQGAEIPARLLPARLRQNSRLGVNLLGAQTLPDLSTEKCSPSKSSPYSML